MGPSILMRNEVRINANSVAVNVTVPSAFKGMFIATKRCMKRFIKIDVD